MSGAISDTLRVLIGDDHRIVREGLKQVLADAPDVQVVAEAQTGAEVLQHVAALRGREEGLEPLPNHPVQEGLLRPPRRPRWPPSLPHPLSRPRDGRPRGHRPGAGAGKPACPVP